MGQIVIKMVSAQITYIGINERKIKGIISQLKVSDKIIIQNIEAAKSDDFPMLPRICIWYSFFSSYF